MLQKMPHFESDGAKAIVVFSDGTGNSAAKLSKTNVWRLYQALDVSTPTLKASESGDLRQIALYDDGVGTSSFKPLALLGGAFGYGLKRNVIDLYKFLCRNYKPGDRIYAFGFSRGAFTIRVLIGMITRVGLVQYHGEKHLSVQSNLAYREYRRKFKPTNLAGIYRSLRDKVIDLYERMRGSRGLLQRVEIRSVQFVGVWDTVAAYGTPIAEMTRAVDRWIWPMSMPDYVLSAKVLQARHALALDDERDTFHPLLWDEVAEDKVIARADGRLEPGRLKQVWFAGMHSDVGGGYPDNNLALVSLDWMMDEAAASGLRFRPEMRDSVRQEKDAFGPMHDSRSGLGTYYRYQPRKLSARLEPPDSATLLMQDPTREQAHGRLKCVTVHQSVIDRIANGSDAYAPIALTPSFKVSQADGNVVDRELAPGQDLVWNRVWRRRITYFFGLATTALFLLMPLLPVSDCNGPQCLVSPAVSAVGGLLPDVLRPWVKAWADNPTEFLLLIAAMAATLLASRALQYSIDDLMSEVWRRTLGLSDSPAEQLRGIEPFILRLRTHWMYQRSLQWLKWRVLPAVFAGLFALIGAVLAVVLFHRIPLAFIDVHTKYCRPGGDRLVTELMTKADDGFVTANPCWSTGLSVESKVRYLLTFSVDSTWRDGDLPPTNPEGFDSSQFGILAPLAAPLRRITGGRWFQPIVTVRDAEGRAHTLPVTVQAVEPQRSGAANGRRYSGIFVAPASGHMFLFVNDVVLPWWDNPQPRFYHNNLGGAAVSLQRLPYE